MKKKLVFVIPNLGAGGAEKSLVTLLNTIDYSLYEVDLILFEKSGLFLNLLPKEVVVLDLPLDCQLFSKKLIASCFQFLVRFRWSLLWCRILFFLQYRIRKNQAVAEQRAWRYFSKSIGLLSNEYDAAIGFLEKSSNYFVVECVAATTKIGFIHNDYYQLQLNSDFDLNYFQKLDYVVTVSDQCKVSLQEVFPQLKNKIKIVRNIVSPALIHKMASEKITDLRTNEPILISVGRLHPQKGFDIAIEAASKIKKRGFKFTWYIIGEGSERYKLENQIVEKGLQDDFVLLGVRANPYPYLKKATIVVQPSRYEGKSIALDEAKILHKPIVTTNFTTAIDQIYHNQNGIIAEMNPESLANGIIKLLQQPNLQHQFSSYLSQEQFGTEDEIFKLYKLLDSKI